MALWGAKMGLEAHTKVRLFVIIKKIELKANWTFTHYTCLVNKKIKENCYSFFCNKWYFYSVYTL